MVYTYLDLDEKSLALQVPLFPYNQSGHSYKKWPVFSSPILYLSYKAKRTNIDSKIGFRECFEIMDHFKPSMYNVSLFSATSLLEVAESYFLQENVRFQKLGKVRKFQFFFLFTLRSYNSFKVAKNDLDAQGRL